MRFTAETYQNPYLPRGARDVHAVVTVTATGEATARASGAEIIIVDTSDSMNHPSRKIKAARQATAVAIDCIRDGVAFGVIAGNDRVRLMYPQGGELVPADDATRALAKDAVGGLRADGGTAIGRWLTFARELFAGAPDGVHHAILLTDGENESETPADLDRALAACEGRFQCDCRGVGTDWKVSELKRIASTLLGGAELIADPAEMADDFRRLMEATMAKATGGVSLRVRAPQVATVEFLKQVSPVVEDLTARGVDADANSTDYPTGAWGAESRDYHVCIRVPEREPGAEMRAGVVSLVADGEAIDGTVAAIMAQWTDDEELSTRIEPQVAHYTGQAELASAIEEGLEARRTGDQETAKLKLGRAVQLAAESKNEGTLQLLQRVVEVEDAATGTVHLRRHVADADEMALDTRSTKTVRIQPGAP
jgi:von Willebrand factor type A C-terminal domain/von Willebrand factor type A domain